MSFPNMTPPMGGMGGGANMQGMSDQEQMMVKGVRLQLHTRSVEDDS